MTKIESIKDACQALAEKFPEKYKFDAEVNFFYFKKTTGWKSCPIEVIRNNYSIVDGILDEIGLRFVMKPASIPGLYGMYMIVDLFDLAWHPLNTIITEATTKSEAAQAALIAGVQKACEYGDDYEYERYDTREDERNV